MAERERLERIEAHARRGSELMNLNCEEHRLNRAAIHEVRDALRSMAAAVNWTTEKTTASLAAMREAIREQTREQSTSMAAMRAEIADSREQFQANTRAVLAVLDELPGPSSAAA